MVDEQTGTATLTTGEDCEFILLLADARRGNSAALGKLLLRFQHQLLRAATRSFEVALRPKVCPQDLVQETLLLAVAGFHHFRGGTPDELFVWLQRILQNHSDAQLRRYFGTAKRDLRLERPLPKDDSSPRGRRGTPFCDQTPSEEAMAREWDEHLAEALHCLPPKYRQVIRLRHRENYSFAQIALTLNCSPEAARKLWSRGVRQLRIHLAEAGERDGGEGTRESGNERGREWGNGVVTTN